MKRIDPISYDIWYEFVRPYVKRSIKRTKEVRVLFSKGPMPSHSHPLVKKIIKNKAGMDGFQAAMMTWGYLAAMCRFHERKLKRK
jgi:acid phosphatase family membrane protein YuiD